MAEHLSPWPEQRPQRTEADRIAFAERAAAHLPNPASDGTVISDEDLAAMKAAFARRFNEELPRTETLMAVAHIGYRMALRDSSPSELLRLTEANEELIRGMTEMAERFTAAMEATKPCTI